MDALTITSIALSMTAMAVSLLTHIKTSHCFGDCFALQTRTPNATTPSTPEGALRANMEKTFLIK